MHDHLVLVNGHEVSDDDDATLERRRRMWNYWNSYGDESNLQIKDMRVLLETSTSLRALQVAG